MTPEASPLDSAVSAEICEAVRRRLDAIAGQWSIAASSRGVIGLTAEHGRRFLARLACLSPDAVPNASDLNTGEMLRQVSVHNLLTGYGLLRQVLLEQITAELGHDLRATEAVALNSRFDELVAREVAAVADAQLNELRAVSESQSKYMSFLSHDLRGGLNGIILMLEVMRRELEGRPEFAESVEDLALMRKSVADIVSIMERHSLAERLRRGRVQISRRTVDWQTVVSGVITEASRQAAAKGLEIVAEVPAGATVQADPELITHVLHNLLENAVKFATRGPICIRVERRDSQWIASISDQGPGMTAERLAQFLDPIRRVDIKEKGLGLIIAQYAARLLQGHLEGESAAGQGTTLRLVIPAA